MDDRPGLGGIVDDRFDGFFGPDFFCDGGHVAGINHLATELIAEQAQQSVVGSGLVQFQLYGFYAETPVVFERLAGKAHRS